MIMMHHDDEDDEEKGSIAAVGRFISLFATI